MDSSRYNRQMLLPEIGPDGQQKLAATTVLLVGLGGLGAPVALYLAAAGVGRLVLVDDDVVSKSNLGRQVLYEESQLGRPKALCAADRLQRLNSEIRIEPHVQRITPETAAAFVADCDIVVDACDNYATRYLLSDAAQASGKPYVYGAIEGYVGQVALFSGRPDAATYRCLYPQEQQLVQQKAALGVVGMTAGMVGSVQAHEVLKWVCGYGETLEGRLWTIDLRTLQSFVLEL